ncbi:hypothetical protein ACF1BN_21415 [Streptomyces sp. NPDC014861]|uniref:hypothetical protein n=1 Tax=Streptomyces sp. NPDC014861 TaxID=3364923 RepID=UPI003702DBE2
MHARFEEQRQARVRDRLLLVVRLLHHGLQVGVRLGQTPPALLQIRLQLRRAGAVLQELRLQRHEAGIGRLGEVRVVHELFEPLHGVLGELRRQVPVDQPVPHTDEGAHRGLDRVVQLRSKRGEQSVRAGLQPRLDQAAPQHPARPVRYVLQVLVQRCGLGRVARAERDRVRLQRQHRMDGLPQLSLCGRCVRVRLVLSDYGLERLFSHRRTPLRSVSGPTDRQDNRLAATDAMKAGGGPGAPTCLAS